MSRYLVTGGAGFIGSHIVEALLRRGDTVRVLDDFSTGRRANLEPFAGDVEIIEGDIRDTGTVARAVKDVDYVLHQAALASVPRSIDDPVSTNAVNVDGTLNLLHASAQAGVARFVYASSSSVYGDSDELPKVETMPSNPLSPYAVSKLAGEWYCRVFGDVYKLPTVSLRYFNIFGPRQDPDSPYAAVIPIFLKGLTSKTSPTIFGDGEQSRDFTFVENAVNANLLACDADTTGGRVYNVACGDRFTLNLLYKKLTDILSVELEAHYGPPRTGDVKHSQASIEAISADLGYKPTVSFEDGLERTVRWAVEEGV